MPASRQLAAIMFTDIVGYTALMGRDEQKAFEFLNKNRQLQKPLIEQYQGRWIKELGDGVMASFATVSDAVTAAIHIQQACNAANEYRLRIGIHLGEVLYEDGDVFGDGVNIASRIQAMAHPGSIFISEAVHHNISNKTEFRTSFVKKAILKNVKEPVRVYQVIADGIVTAPAAATTRIPEKNRKALVTFLLALLLLGAGYFSRGFWMNRNDTRETGTPEKSIAILPFMDLSPDKDQEYLSDGLAEEIINSITIIKDLKVIGRTSSFQFKGKGLDAQAIGEKLKVATVLEGSIQKSGNILRIIAKLIRVADNSTIWSQRFDKELKDIFAIQDSIASNIVEQLKLTVSAAEKPRLIKKETDPAVYALYLKGLHTYKAQEFDKSIDYNLQAIGMDSLFAPSYAYIALARSWKIYWSNTFSDIHAIRETRETALKAIRLDPDLAEGYSALALLSWTVELDFAAARANFEKSIQLNPSASLIKNRYGYFLVWMGEFEKVETLAREAISSDPADFNGYILVASANMYRKKFRDAEKYIAEGQRLFPGHRGFIYLQASNIFYSGQYAELIRYVNSLLSEKPDYERAGILSLLAVSYLHTGKPGMSREIVRKMGEAPLVPNSSLHYHLARIYLQLQQKDSCYWHLQKSFALREQAFKQLKIDPLFDPIRKEPAYLDLYHRYGFDRYP